VLLPLSFAIVAVINPFRPDHALIVALPDFPRAARADVAHRSPMSDVAARRWQASRQRRARLAHQITPYAGTNQPVFVHARLGGRAVRPPAAHDRHRPVLYRRERAMDWCVRSGGGPGGERGEEMVAAGRMAIRSVALGVRRHRRRASLVAGIGLWLAGIPQAGVLSRGDLLLWHRPARPPARDGAAAVWLFVTAPPARHRRSGLCRHGVILDNLLRPFLIKPRPICRCC